MGALYRGPCPQTKHVTLRITIAWPRPLRETFQPLVRGVTPAQTRAYEAGPGGVIATIVRVRGKLSRTSDYVAALR